MTRKKKSPTPEKKTIFPGVELISDGKGFARETRISVQYDVASPEHIKAFIHSMAAFEDGGFEREIAIYEREAIKTLEVAGLPINLGGSRTIPMEWDVSPPKTFEKLYFHFYRAFPEYGGIGLMELVKSRGYRRRESQEWYAAAIVETLSVIRAAIKRKDTDWALRQAFRLGKYVVEAKALGFFKQAGAMGPPSRKRRIIPIAELVRYLIRKNRHGTAADLWNMIPTDQINGFKILGYKFYRNTGRLRALGRVDGCKDPRPVGKPLKYSAFRKHVSEARKKLTR
jgi:hypothetical protein